MNFFCRLFGHTWTHQSKSPKTSWNVDKDGQQLFATPVGEVVFWEECARCHDRRNERRIPVETPPRPTLDDASAEAEEADEEAAAAS